MNIDDMTLDQLRAHDRALDERSGKIGVAGSGLTFDACKNGWLKYSGTPQNSTVAPGVSP